MLFFFLIFFFSFPVLVKKSVPVGVNNKWGWFSFDLFVSVSTKCRNFVYGSGEFMLLKCGCLR